MSIPQIAAAVGAFVLLAGGVVWRLLLRRRSATLARRVLTSPDPVERAAAVAVLATRGLSTHARVFEQLSQEETTPSVRRALAEAVARNQWEPAHDPRLLGLRIWAQHELDDHGDGAANGTRPSSDGGGVAAAPATRSNASGTPASGPSGAPRAAANGAAGGAGGARVVVTGAGGPAGVAVIRALVAQGHHVVAVDSDPLAVGMRLAPAQALVPRAGDRNFVPTLAGVARQSGAEALISTVAEEMVALNAGRALLCDAGTATWLSESFVIELCTDKWLFHDITSSLGLPVPATNLGSAEGVPGPWVVKPFDGRGSRDVYLVDDPGDLAAVVARVPGALVQQRVTGREFTVDVLADRDHRLVAAVPRWRLETRGGISTKGETFALPAVTELMARVTSSLRLQGPANVQGFVRPDGSVVLIEVNPRFSGGLPLTLAAGCDTVGTYLQGILGRPLPETLMAYRSGVRMIRHFDEVFEG